VPAATRTTTTDLDRIVAHLCAVEDAVAEWTEPLPWGTAVFHRGVPWVREVNVVRVEATHAVRPGDIAFAAESRLPEAPAVEVLHEPIGADVAPAFAAAGWQVSRHLLMALEAAAPEPMHAVEEVDPKLIWPLRAEWMRAEPWGTAAAVTAMLEWERITAGLDLRTLEARAHLLILLTRRLLVGLGVGKPLPLDERRVQFNHLLRVADTPAVKRAVLQRAFDALWAETSKSTEK